MSTFYGTEICAIDAKGRLNVPARMRRGLDPEANDTFVIVRGFEGCVNMYPHDEWTKYLDKLSAIKAGSDDGRAFQRVLLGSAHQATLDGQGRVSISADLLAMAGVTTEAKLLGALDHIEVWNPKRFDELAKSATPNFEDLARKLFS
jgi:MraZ protein